MNDYETLGKIREFEAYFGISGYSVENQPIINQTPRKPGIVIGSLRLDTQSGEIVVKLNPPPSSKVSSVKK